MKRTKVTMMIIGAAVLALAAVSLAACGGAGKADDAALLLNKDWVARSIAGTDAVPPADQGSATATFKEGTISGSGTINSYTAGYETGPGNSIKILSAAATLMAGPPEAMDQEAAYFAALEKAATYVVTENSLELRDDKGQTLVKYEVLKPTPLTGTQWKALAYNNGQGGLESVAADSTITAMFAEDGKLAGNAGVNEYNTTYTTMAGEAMTIAEAIATTRMAGPENLMAQEAAYLAALSQTATYTIQGNELWLRDKAGAALAQFVAE